MLRRWTTALAFLLAACAAPATAPSASPAASRAAVDRLLVESDAGTQILDAKTGGVLETLPGGLLAPSNDLIVRVETTAAGTTAVRGVDLDGLPFLTVDLPGRYALPTAYGAAPSGFSPNGKWLVLVSRDATDSHFAIVDVVRSKVAQLVDLSARFTFDAIHNDGSAMYLIEHPRADSTTYNVRLYDLITRTLQAQPIFDQKAIARYDPNVGLMDGTFHVSVAPKAGDWSYGLYMRPAGTPFVHALNVPGRYATCIVDLAGTWTKQSMFSMALTADGRLLYVVDAGNGSITAINGDTHQVWRRATFAGRPGDADSRAASAMVSPDGARLYATAVKGIAVIQTSDLTLKQWFANGLAARSLAVSGDGRGLFALSGDAVHAIDTATGAATRLATVGDGARAVHLLSLP